MKTQTKPKTSNGSGTVWPPLAHLTRERPPKEGSLALCGAKLMGLDLPNATKVCRKCVEIAKRCGS